MCIEKAKHETERQVLMGFCGLFLQRTDLSQECFRKSANPTLLLDLKLDLQEFGHALKLAESIDPPRVPSICKKFAIQLETKENFVEARKMFERGLSEGSHYTLSADFNEECYAGIARTSIKLGENGRALNISQNLNSQNLLKEIASTFENMHQMNEAALMFEKIGDLEKAANIYIQSKHLKKAGLLLDKIKSPKLLRELAKSKEAEKLYADAEKAFEKAGDWENVIRLNLKFLQNADKAKDIQRTKCQTPTAATMIAEYCEEVGNKKEATEFLIKAGKKEEAFIIAQSHDLMDTYSEIINKLDPHNQSENSRIAQYFEGKNQWGKAAIHYDKCDNPSKALKLFFQAGESYLDDAISMVGRLNNETLTNQMVDYLM